MIGSIKSGFVADPSFGKVNADSKKPKASNSTQSAEKCDKLSEISKAIENGTYKIDLDKTAKAIVSEIF